MEVSIIGAGVSGLIAGCYLQMSGFHSKIFERHTSSGGLCTSWKKNKYTFESGFQWLLGSGPCKYMEGRNIEKLQRNKLCSCNYFFC